MKKKYLIFKLIIVTIFLTSCATKIMPVKKNCSDTKINTSNTKQMAQKYLDLSKCEYKHYEFNFSIKHLNNAIEEYKKLTERKPSYQLKLAQSYELLGNNYFDLKKYTDALQAYKEALTNYESYYPTINSPLINIRKLLGKTYIELKDTSSAIKILNFAEINSDLIDSEKPSMLTLELRAKLATLDNTIDYKSKIILKKFRNKVGRNSLELANLYRWMAEEYLSKNKIELSAKYYQKSSDIYESKLSLFHPNRYETLYHLSILDKKLGKYKKYLQHSILAFKSYYENRKKVFSSFSVDEQKAFSKKRKKYLYNLFDALSLYHDKKTLQQAFTLWLNYKRSIFDFENSLTILSKKDKSLALKIQHIKENQRKLAKLYDISLDYKKDKKELLEEITNLEQIISREFFTYIKDKNFKFNQLQTLLKKENKVYIDFAKVNKCYYSFLVDNRGDILFQKTNQTTSQSIDESIRKIHIDTENPVPTILKEYKSLYSSIFTSFEEKVKNSNSLIISPDGLLNVVPFEAFKDNKDTYLVQKYCISYTPSGKEYIKSMHQKAKANSGQNIIFANADFNLTKSQKRKLGLTNEFTNLTYALNEVRAVEQYLKEPILYLEENATEENLTKIISPSMLHITAHGFIKENSNNINPMINCGIALHGVNESIRNHKEEGIVRGLELASMNLQGTNLVVLSACLTGRGEIENSEGVASISKAFRLAGAKYLVTTLWSIDDKLTAEFMKKFYQNINNKMSYSKALHETKKELSKRYHPNYWAAFVGSGRDN